MNYNFDEKIQRKNTHSVKWDSAGNAEVLPMWVADMDFKAAPEIITAISDKIAHGVFGYSLTPDKFHQSIINWWKTQHQFTIEKEWILPTSGMLLSLSAIIRTFVKADEAVILQPPVYNHFFTLVENCGCRLVENNLINRNGDYQIDFEDLEHKASDPKTTLLLISNPHNPVGRVWKKEELERIAEICAKHHVMVVSDEIHADLVFEPHYHIPFASIGGNDLFSVTCGSPCKTFNISGLPISYMIVQDSRLRDRIRKTLETQETIYPNPISADALIAAYTNGKSWMDGLKKYLWKNYQYLQQFCKDHLPNIKITPLQATYLVWLDCSYLNLSSDEIAGYLLEKEKVWLNSGTLYGKAGEGFLRMNIACPRTQLAEALKRLEHLNKMTRFVLKK